MVGRWRHDFLPSYDWPVFPARHKPSYLVHAHFLPAVCVLHGHFHQRCGICAAKRDVPNRVRGLAMSIAGFALWIGTYLIGQLTPWMLENLTPAGTFFLFAFMCLPYLWIMYKHVPNTTGKSLEEIEAYWKAK